MSKHFYEVLFLFKIFQILPMPHFNILDLSNFKEIRNILAKRGKIRKKKLRKFKQNKSQI